MIRRYGGSWEQWKLKKAVGLDEVPVKVWTILESEDLSNKVLVEGWMSAKCRKSFVIPTYLYLKTKETYSNVEIIEHKVYESWYKDLEMIIDKRIRISNLNQSGFCLESWWWSRYFVLDNLYKKYRKKKKSFVWCLGINLETARVPREVLKWALIRKEVPKIYINVIENTYVWRKIFV